MRPNLTRLERAIRIRQAVVPTLSNTKLFRFNPHCPFPMWVSRDFHIATAITPRFKSLEVWPVNNGSGLKEHPEAEGKVMNLHRTRHGQYELVSFRHGGWEKALLRYVDAPLGLLTLRAC
jgi:hypothetical protein